MNDDLQEIIEEWFAAHNGYTAWPYCWTIREPVGMEWVCKMCKTTLDYDYNDESFECRNCNFIGGHDESKWVEESMPEYWTISRVFLTRRDAVGHLKKYRYNYHAKAHIWIQHFYRGPDTEMILDFIVEQAKKEGIDYPVGHTKTSRPYPKEEK